MDFTLKTYKRLLQTLQEAGYPFITFSEYVESRTSDVGSSFLPVASTGSATRSYRYPKPRTSTEPKASSAKLHRTPDTPHPIPHTPPPNRAEGELSEATPHTPFIILRHDVDLLPQNSLAFARIQHQMGIRGSYYFRAVPESWDEDIIKEIHALGHEVGYHYEDLDLVRSGKSEVGSPGYKTKDRRLETEVGRKETPQSDDSTIQQINEPLIDAAILSFRKNLEKLRLLVPVKTICMHGSPRSKYDNRDLWKKYDYRDFGILGEPYFDMDFDDVFYLTDTGRQWDGWKVSIRDKVPQQEEWIKRGLVFGSTGEIIDRVKRLELSFEREALRDQSGKIFNPQTPTEPKASSAKLYPKPTTPFPPKVMFTFHPQRWTDRPLPWFKEWVMQSVKNRVKYFINLRRV